MKLSKLFMFLILFIQGWQLKAADVSLVAGLLMKISQQKSKAGKPQKRKASEVFTPQTDTHLFNQISQQSTQVAYEGAHSLSLVLASSVLKPRLKEIEVSVTSDPDAVEEASVASDLEVKAAVSAIVDHIKSFITEAEAKGEVFFRIDPLEIQALVKHAVQAKLSVAGHSGGSFGRRRKYQTNPILSHKMCAATFVLRFLYGNSRALYIENERPIARGINFVIKFFDTKRKVLRRYLKWSLGFSCKGSSSKAKWNYESCDYSKAARKGLYFCD